MSVFISGSEEKYTPEVCIDILNKAYQFLTDHSEICFDNQLRAELDNAGIIPYHTFYNINYKKHTNNVDVQLLKKKINDTLEYRKCFEKKMYPGIAVMALKNKHGWQDKQEIKQDITGDITVNKLYDEVKDE